MMNSKQVYSQDPNEDSSQEDNATLELCQQAQEILDTSISGTFNEESLSSTIQFVDENPPRMNNVISVSFFMYISIIYGIQQVEKTFYQKNA